MKTNFGKHLAKKKNVQGQKELAAEKRVETLTTNLVTTTTRKQVPVAQKMLIKDVQIDNFHGRNNEDISPDEITSKYRKKTKKRKKEKNGFVADWSRFDVTAKVNYRDILQAEKKQKSHSWSNETIKQTERK